MKPLVYKKAKRVRHQAPVRMKLHITKGDTVQVISGEDKGKRGRVLRVNPKTGRVTIEGVNMVKRHRRATQTTEGGIVEFAAPIHHSKAMLIDPKSRRAHPGPPAPGCRRHRGADRREVGPADPEEPVTWRKQRKRTERRKGRQRRTHAPAKGARPGRARARTRAPAGAVDHDAQGGGGNAAAAGVLREDGPAQAGQGVRARPTRTRCRGW